MVTYLDLDNRFDKKADKAQVVKLQNIMDGTDGLAKLDDNDDQERAAINSQLDRHDCWIGKLSAGHGTNREFHND